MNENELYYDHNGRWPGIAYVTSISDGVVYLRRKTNEKSKRWHDFALSISAFNSPACGWKKRHANKQVTP